MNCLQEGLEVLRIHASLSENASTSASTAASNAANSGLPRRLAAATASRPAGQAGRLQGPHGRRGGVPIRRSPGPFRLPAVPRHGWRRCRRGLFVIGNPVGVVVVDGGSVQRRKPASVNNCPDQVGGRRVTRRAETKVKEPRSGLTRRTTAWFLRCGIVSAPLRVLRPAAPTPGRPPQSSSPASGEHPNPRQSS